MFFRERTVGGGKTLEAPVGAVLGERYRVRSILGTGGMAVVYEAEDAILGRRVALKTLHRRFAEEVSFRLRFGQEARVMASLDHENIVKVYDICQEDEVPFIVAEYVDGRDVGGMLKEAGGRLGEQFVREMAEQLLGALEYAHRRGVVHRDVKPSNILVTPEGTIKVADFGIARVMEEEEDGGAPGEIVGSARYMSPEQLRGEETTPCSDLYSVGVLLYHCLVGRPPFSGDAQSVARQQAHKEPTPPGRLNKEISPSLEAVILKALARDPQDRYPSASAMLEDLRKGSGTGDAPGVEGAVAGASGVTGSRKRRRKGRRARKALLFIPVLALLLLGAGTAAAAGLGYVGLPGVASRQSEEASLVASAPPAQEAEESGAEESGAEDDTAGTPESEAGEEDPEETMASEETEESPAETSESYVPVPNVDTLFDYFAEETLRGSGLQTRVFYEYRPGYLPGVVWGTDPVAGTPVPSGSTVTVYATPGNTPQPVQAQPPAAPPPVQQQPPVQPAATPVAAPAAPPPAAQAQPAPAPPIPPV